MIAQALRNDPYYLNSQVEFDCPFAITESGRVVQGAPGSIHTPRVEHDDFHDMLIDGVPYRNNSHWEALTGYTGQYGYRGPVMHPSEQLAGGIASDVLETPGVYVVTAVECEPTDDDPDPFPAGWAILRWIGGDL